LKKIAKLIINNFKYGLYFILLILLQGLILNNVALFGYVNPYLYILFILFLPISTPKWLVLILGFFLGLSIDVFSSTLGLHTSATVFLAFCRPYVLKLIKPRDDYEFGALPNIYHLGLIWYLTYISILVFLHHFFLFFIEAFKFSQFFDTLFRTILSSIFTIITILIVQLFSYKSKTRI